MTEQSQNPVMENVHEKYQSYAQVDIPDRTWPGTVISKAPIWCSVDLRDGNNDPLTAGNDGISVDVEDNVAPTIDCGSLAVNNPAGDDTYSEDGAGPGPHILLTVDNIDVADDFAPLTVLAGGANATHVSKHAIPTATATGR